MPVLLAGDKFIPENYLRRPGYTYSAFRSFTKNKERTHLIKCYSIKNLILLKIQNMMDIKAVLLQWFTIFLIRRLQVVLLKVKICQSKN